MSGDPPNQAKCLIAYLYTMTYNETFRDAEEEKARADHPNSTANLEVSTSSTQPQVQEIEWVWDVEMLKLADKYNLDRLMALARRDILGGADRKTPYALDHLPGFIAMVKALYGCGSSLAAERLRRDVFRHFNYVINYISKRPELRRLTEDVPAFACDMLEVVGDHARKKAKKNEGRGDETSCSDESDSAQERREDRIARANRLGLDTLTKRMYFALAEEPRYEGIQAGVLAGRFNVTSREIHQAADILDGHGLIYTTVDESTWSVLDYD